MNTRIRPTESSRYFYRTYSEKGYTESPYYPSFSDLLSDAVILLIPRSEFSSFSVEVYIEDREGTGFFADLTSWIYRGGSYDS